MTQWKSKAMQLLHSIQMNDGLKEGRDPIVFHGAEHCIEKTSMLKEKAADKK